MELRPEEITKIIRSQIKNYEAKLETAETGVVIVVGDGASTFKYDPSNGEQFFMFGTSTSCLKLRHSGRLNILLGCLFKTL